MPTIKELQEKAHGYALRQGFWDDFRAHVRRDGYPVSVEGPVLKDRVLRAIPEKVALLHSEISEMLEAYRERPGLCAAEGLYYELVNSDKPGPGVVMGPNWIVRTAEEVERCCFVLKPAGIREEAADTVIRLMDLCGALGIDLERAVLEKMAYNEHRPFKHGKSC